MLNLFKYLDYKKFLKDLLIDRQERGFQTRLAKAADCQSAYLSRILNSTPHLTSEQAVGIADFLQFNELESGYFLDLVAFARAGTASLRSRLKRRLEKTKQDNEELSQRYSTVRLEEGFKESVYYSAWNYAAIHIATGIPGLQHPKAIAQRLGLPEKLVIQTLSALKQFDLVKVEGERWIYNSGQLHLPRQSMMTAMNHANWRHKALLDIQKQDGLGLHYSVVHSHSIEDFEKLKELLITTIDQSRKISGTSANEDISVICLDCFRL